MAWNRISKLVLFVFLASPDRFMVHIFTRSCSCITDSWEPSTWAGNYVHPHKVTCVLSILLHVILLHWSNCIRWSNSFGQGVELFSVFVDGVIKDADDFVRNKFLGLAPTLLLLKLVRDWLWVEDDKERVRWGLGFVGVVLMHWPLLSFIEMMEVKSLPALVVFFLP